MNFGKKSHVIYSLYHNLIVAECLSHGDCTGASDTCVSNVCRCGSSVKCTGRTDTCISGSCKCGNMEECSEGLFCTRDGCQGTLMSRLGRLFYLKGKKPFSSVENQLMN